MSSAFKILSTELIVFLKLWDSTYYLLQFGKLLLGSNEFASKSSYNLSQIELRLHQVIQFTVQKPCSQINNLYSTINNIMQKKC